ncbi:MAG: D-inositol-3-phosphate glycosyltransferase [Burkholderiaceae bacterium]|nr:D-inositol-3-phosphate glycosyltransferase [Burkholderiaceae bacterium]
MLVPALRGIVSKDLHFGMSAIPLVAHVMHRFDTGGLENGVVNLINHMPATAYRHMVIALTEVTSFRSRLNDHAIECIGLGKTPGNGARLYPRLWRLFRHFRPAIVHTRNLGALEMQFPAWAARVPVRVHGEHGRDIDDPDGRNPRHQRQRYLYSPFVSRYVALSRDLAQYLSGPVGISSDRVEQIYNGVDIDHFQPASPAPTPIAGCPFLGPEYWRVGSVGRMQAVKDPLNLVRAFIVALRREPAFSRRGRLILVGEGPLRAQALSLLGEAGADALAWVPGERSDVADIMRGLDCFVLPSLAEGVSNTILEAMASGLPVLATAVGGNPELVAQGRTGALVRAGDPQELASAILDLASHPTRAREWGRAARVEAEARFSLPAMVARYQELYDRQLAAAGYRRESNVRH